MAGRSGSGKRTGAEDPSLLLVPGYMDSVNLLPICRSRTPHWQAFVEGLRDRGYDGSVRGVDFGTAIGTPRRYAQRVETASEKLFREEGAPINAVAYSMGGLAARWAVEKGDGHSYLDTLVTLGTPHRGSPLAVWGLLTPGGRDMIPGSPFLDKLNSGGLEQSVEYLSVYSDSDEGFPGEYTENAALPGTGEHENAENLRVEDSSHWDFLLDDGILDKYYEHLTR